MNAIKPEDLDTTLDFLTETSQSTGVNIERTRVLRIINAELDGKLNGFELKILKRIYDKVVEPENKK